MTRGHKLLFVVGLCFLLGIFTHHTSAKEEEEEFEYYEVEVLEFADDNDATTVVVDSTTVTETTPTLPSYVSILVIKSFTLTEYEEEGTQAKLQQSIADVLNMHCDATPGVCDAPAYFRRRRLLADDFMEEAEAEFADSTTAAPSTLVSAEDVNITNVYEVTTDAALARFSVMDVRIEYIVTLMSADGVSYNIPRDVVDTAVTDNSAIIETAVGKSIEVIPESDTATTTETPTEDPKTNEDNGGLETYSIVLIAVASVVGVTGVGYATYYYGFKKSTKNDGTQLADDVTTYQGLTNNKRSSDYDELFPANGSRDSGTSSNGATSSFQYDNPSYDTIGETKSSLAEKKVSHHEEGSTHL